MAKPNPFVKHFKSPQHVSWKYFETKKEFQFELILPFESVVQEIRGYEGSYLILAARSVKDQKVNKMLLLEDERVIIDFALKTFERMWIATSRSFRKSFGEDDNVIIHFMKESKQSMRLKKIERVKCIPEDKQFAREVYDQANEKAKDQVVVRNREAY